MAHHRIAGRGVGRPLVDDCRARVGNCRHLPRQSLIGIAIVLAGMYGTTATIYWGQWWWWRVNFWSWLTAMVGGPCVYAMLGGLSLGGLSVPGVLSLSPAWAEARASESSAQGMDMLQAALGMAITCAAWVVVTLITRPEPMETLVEFYHRARPMGHWGPVRQRCLAAEPNWEPPPEGLLLSGLRSGVGRRAQPFRRACLRHRFCLLAAGPRASCWGVWPSYSGGGSPSYSTTGCVVWTPTISPPSTRREPHWLAAGDFTGGLRYRSSNTLACCLSPS